MEMEKSHRINILGTEYEVIETNEVEDKTLKGCDGYCDTSIKKCVVDEMCPTEGARQKKNMQYYKKAVIRHELIHAILFESGLDVCSWAQNEEMVDWIAIQFPKLLKTFQECDCL